MNKEIIAKEKLLKKLELNKEALERKYDLQSAISAELQEKLKKSYDKECLFYDDAENVQFEIDEVEADINYLLGLKNA